MANPNYQMIRYQADNIPLFDGNAKQINRFLKACENLLTNHQDANNPRAAINICLFDTILSKLVGRAADLIASRVELDTWAKIKTALLNTFSDQRSIDCLVQDLISMRPDRNESPQSFGLRLQDTRSLLVSKLNSGTDANEVKLLKIQQYEDITLKTFINGLNYHMQLVVRLKNPQTLEQAISFALEEENFILYKTRAPSNNKTVINTLKTNQRPHQSQTTIRHQPPRNFMPQTPYFRQTPMFSQPTFSPQPTYFRQPNTFSQPFPQPFGQNQFVRPQNNAFQQKPAFTQIPQFPQSQTFKQNIPFGNKTSSKMSKLPKPEPMDTSSSNSRFAGFGKKTQQRQNRPGFIPEELFNQTVNTEFDDPYENDNVYEECSNYSDTNNEQYEPENTNEYEFSELYSEQNNYYDLDNEEQNFQHTAYSQNKR